MDSFNDFAAPVNPGGMAGMVGNLPRGASAVCGPDDLTIDDLIARLDALNADLAWWAEVDRSARRLDDLAAEVEAEAEEAGRAARERWADYCEHRERSEAIERFNEATAEARRRDVPPELR